MGLIRKILTCDNGIILANEWNKVTKIDKEVKEWNSKWIESCKIRNKESR